MARTGIFFGTTTRRLRVGDVVETFGGPPGEEQFDRGEVRAVDVAARAITVEFRDGVRVWRPAWGREAKGAVHVSCFMTRADDRLGEGVYDSARAVHGEAKV